MLQDIYYSRRSNKAVQVIAQCRMLPEGTEAVCFQEMSGNYDVFVLGKEHFARIFSKRKGEGYLPEEDIETNRIEEEEIPKIQGGSDEDDHRVIELGQNVEEAEPEEDNSSECEDIVQPEAVVRSEEEHAEENDTDDADGAEDGDAPAIIRFLDADTYEEKMKVLEERKDELDEHTLNNMAVSLDLSLEDGIDAYSLVMSELRIRSRYEGKRGDRLRK